MADHNPDCSGDLHENESFQLNDLGLQWIMLEKKVLILDYSTDKSEAAAILQWIPERVDAVPLFVDSARSFPDDLPLRGFTHIIHSGSSCSINTKYSFSEQSESFIREMRDRGAAQFGICYGHQLLCLALEGEEAVRPSPRGLEAGWEEVEFTEEGIKLLSVNPHERVWQSHFDEAVRPPRGAVLLATGVRSAIQAFYHRENRLLGTQFHPEFDREWGGRLFLRDRNLFEENNLDLDLILRRGPSFDAGRVFFRFFLDM